MTIRSQLSALSSQPDQLWTAYKAAPSEELRNQLVEHYLPLVRRLARRLAATCPDLVDVEDLASAGVFGLLTAIDGFDPERGVKFESYSPPRIRGAMLDWLREMDWVPRLVRVRAARARRRLEQELGRQPADREVYEQPGVTEPVTVGSLYARLAGTDALRPVDVLEDSRSQDPALPQRRRELLHLLLKGCSRSERLLVILYYYEELTMKEVGASLLLSESRVSQVHKQLLARLRRQLASRREECAA